jgi:hypothetical protein
VNGFGKDKGARHRFLLIRFAKWLGAQHVQARVEDVGDDNLVGGELATEERSRP